mgnify:CR=1 FL=1
MKRRKFLTLGSAALMAPFVPVSPTGTKIVPPLSISTSGLTETGGVLTKKMFKEAMAKLREMDKRGKSQYGYYAFCYYPTYKELKEE